MKIHENIPRRRGISIVEAVVALTIIMLISAATTTLVLRASEVEGKVATTMERNEHIENIIECYQWANGNANAFSTAMEAVGYEDGVTVDAPTCTGSGSITCRCSECGESHTVSLNPLGHTYDNAVVEFSEDRTTYTVTVTCPKCGEDVEGHTKTSESLYSSETGSATGDCQNPSTKTYQAKGKFERVDYEDNKTVEGEMGDHIWTDATCTVPKTCSVCSETEGDPLGHKDEDKDHVCDNGCEVYQGEHADSNADNDHACDYCGKELTDSEQASDEETNDA